MRTTLTALPDIPLIQPGDDLLPLILAGMAQAGLQLQEGDILVLAHKIISKAEGRLVRLSSVEPSEQAQELAQRTGKDARYIQVVLDEAVRVERVREGLIVTEQRGGWVVANSAVDRSNVAQEGEDEQLLLLPLDPDASARTLRARLAEATGVRVGIVINDTHGRPFRKGAVGVAIGVAGIRALVDLRGRADLFGYTLQHSEVATADEIASAASLLQGQAAEASPIVHLRGLAVEPSEESSARALQRPRELDMFR